MTLQDDGDTRRDANPEQESEEDQHRRSRLWLGYSEDNLRKSLQSNGLQGIESSGPEGSPDQPRATSQLASPPARESNASPESYTIPNDYENLDEIAIPSPIDSPKKEKEHGFLEDRNRASEPSGTKGIPSTYDHLNEIAVPLPIQKEQEQEHNEHLKEGAISPSLSRKKSQNENAPTNRQQVSKLFTEVYTICYLILFSILGTLARLGLQALTFYPGAPVQTGLLWANVGGSLIMGFLSEDKKLFREEWGTHNDEEHAKKHQRTPSMDEKHLAVKKTLPLYIGLATGFCGSFTSFSSFMRDAFFALSNALPVPIQHPSSAPISQTVNVPRNGGYSFLALLAVLIATLGLSLQALRLGAHIALFLEPYTPSIPYLFGRRVVDRSVVFLAIGCWLAALIMAIWPPDRPAGPVGNASWGHETWRSQALFALVFAPLGCLLRFYASLHLNSKAKSFPLGTFAVNIFGCALEATFVDLQRIPVGGMVGCQVLQGMSDGFCGCLTTVSTWVAELNGLRLRHAYYYGLISVGLGLSLFIIITGSLQWTRGFAHPLCAT